MADPLTSEQLAEAQERLSEIAVPLKVQTEVGSVNVYMSLREALDLAADPQGPQLLEAVLTDLAQRNIPLSAWKRGEGPSRYLKKGDEPWRQQPQT